MRLNVAVIMYGWVGNAVSSYVVSYLGQVIGKQDWNKV